MPHYETFDVISRQNKQFKLKYLINKTLQPKVKNMYYSFKYYFTSNNNNFRVKKTFVNLGCVTQETHSKLIVGRTAYIYIYIYIVNLVIKLFAGLYIFFTICQYVHSNVVTVKEIKYCSLNTLNQ